MSPILMSPGRVVEALEDLVDRLSAPLRVPVGATAEHVLAARNNAPYDEPFVRA